MHVFVTVGTTMFEELIQCVCSKTIQEKLSYLGYTSMVIQSGRTELVEDEVPESGLSLSWYNYKPSLSEVSRLVSVEG